VTAVNIRSGTSVDRAATLELLKAASLPIEDLSESAPVRFWVAEDGGRLVGAIGLERYGADGLLRSLVVAPDWRGRGVGAALVEALERDARFGGVEMLVLLTQTARPFFERLGYTVAERDSVPGLVRASTEFRSLCPASAACMTKNLRGTNHGARNG
jgi:N-acetylglutamate synthase-like GNAT family acetyltransferase